MKLIFTIAFRNILRNKKRSFITLLAVALGIGSMIFLRSFAFGAQSQMVKNIISTITSEAQIFPKSMDNIYNTNGAIEDPEFIRRLLKADPRISGYAEEISGSGIVASATASVMTFVNGIDPAQEQAIGGRYPLAGGHLMTAAEPYGAVLGEKMRKILGVEIGDKVVVTVQDYLGGFSGAAFTLVGTLDTGNDQIDNSNVLILREPAQKLMSFHQQISRFCLKMHQREDLPKVVHDLTQQLAGTDLKVMTWEELIPMMAQMIHFQDGMIFVVLLIVLIVVTVGILNTLMMSIVERVREFGLMMALGTKPSQVILLVVCESFLLTLFGAGLGIALGISLTLYFGATGIDLSRFVATLSNFMIGSHVYPRIDWHSLGLFVLVVIVANLLISLYPAWRASRLVPIHAMRQV